MIDNKIPNTPLLVSDIWMAYPTKTSKRKCKFGMYRCYCGNIFRSYVVSINNGDVKSCGCYFKKCKTKHGLKKHSLYITWVNMRQRVNNKNSTHFEDYGGRGIKVCTEWQNDFMPFYDWAMANGYSEELSIDRIDPNGNYEPCNCRFTTKAIQSRNTRCIQSHNTSGYRGVSWHNPLSKWRAQITINGKKKHLGYFNSTIEAAKAYDSYVIEDSNSHLTVRVEAHAEGSDDKCAGKALSYAVKNAMLKVLMLETGENDEEGVKNSIDAKQLATINQLIIDTDTDIEKFCGAYKITKVSDLPSGMFLQALSQLQKKMKDKQ